MKKRQSSEQVTNPLHGQFDQMVDAVLGDGAGIALPERVKPEVEAWSVPLKDIYQNEGMRLDATHYDRETATALQTLKGFKCPLKLLSEIADVRLPGQFVRIWAKGKDFGIPYLNASDLINLNAMGTLGEGARYLSLKTNVDIEELKIRKDWLAVSCSGTIGRVFYIPPRLDGAAATHDLIRIVPHAETLVGYLYAYLCSPLAQSQILRHTHGGQIDHVTDIQVGSILVPWLVDKMEDVHKKVMHALRAREQAIISLVETTEALHKSLIK